MKTTTQQNNVQATSTQNNVAKIYTIFDIQTNKTCKVKFNNEVYNAKLLNTNPTTHLIFTSNNTKYDILLPATITNENGEKFSTKTTIANYEGTDNQTRFATMLSKITNMQFSFDKTQKAQRNANTIKTNVMQYIQNNEQLKTQFEQIQNDYNNAKTQFEQAKQNFDTFINDCKQKAQQQNASNTIQNLLNSGILTNEQIQAILQGGTN